MSGIEYEVSVRQLFNEFGAPGIPNTYRATLRDPSCRIIMRRDFCWRRKADRQAERWAIAYGAIPVREDIF